MLQSTFFKPQDPHGIQGIDKRQTQAKPLVVGLGEGPELIMAPSKVFITLPRMSESFPHCLWPASFWNAKKKMSVYHHVQVYRGIQKQVTETFYLLRLQLNSEVDITCHDHSQTQSSLLKNCDAKSV